MDKVLINDDYEIIEPIDERNSPIRVNMKEFKIDWPLINFKDDLIFTNNLLLDNMEFAEQLSTFVKNFTNSIGGFETILSSNPTPWDRSSYRITGTIYVINQPYVGQRQIRETIKTSLKYFYALVNNMNPGKEDETKKHMAQVLMNFTCTKVYNRKNY